MSGLSSNIGRFTVTMRGVAATADSNDADTIPEAYGLSGTVVFKPVGIPKGYLVNDIDVEFIMLRTVTALLYNGEMYAPANGLAPTPGEIPTVAPGVNIIAPVQAAFDPLSWYWVATVAPDDSQKGQWAAFSVPFTGVPDEVVALAERAIRIPPTGALVQQPKVWVQNGTAIPVEAVAGQWILDKTTNNLYVLV